MHNSTMVLDERFLYKLGELRKPIKKRSLLPELCDLHVHDFFTFTCLIRVFVELSMMQPLPPTVVVDREGKER